MVITEYRQLHYSSKCQRYNIIAYTNGLFGIYFKNYYLTYIIFLGRSSCIMENKLFLAGEYLLVLT